MRRENMLLVALLIVLSSCQKKAEVEQAPAEQAVKPAAAEVPAVQPVVEAPAKAQPGNVSSEVSPKPGVVIVAGKLEMPPLAKKNNCTACHAIDHKVVGPAWMDVSKAYNSNGTTTTGKKVADILKEHNAKTPEEWLVQKVSKG
ncbi:MAG TPA: hypothetical protein VFF41_00445, partial [Gallionella sp.]|nr:hypothetical protein [Gallionella sp.]